jgi:hypothetical protein
VTKLGKKRLMEDMDHAKVKDKVIKLKKRVAGETGPEVSSEEELITVRSRKEQNKSLNDGLKQSSETTISK